jgi:GMP synthase-like glutamine amidotransferase
LRIHYLQHVEFEDAANIVPWAEARGHAVNRTRLYENEPLPPADAFDWLVIMGGPMNIDEHDRYPWLVREKQFIAETIGRNKPVLGICLGAQLLADVLGGRVTPNGEKEIGWFPVSLTDGASGLPVFRALPEEFLPFHWHGDTFSIPPGAVHAAGSEACANQAFQYGDRVVGLQFHLDYSAASIGKMIQSCGDELVEAPHIQRSPERLTDPVRVANLRGLLDRFLDAMERQVRREAA